MENIIVSIYQIEDITKVKQAGATSIILGSEFFSVRSTSYFKINELIKAIQIVKENGLQVYVLVNRFFIEEELPQLKLYLNMLLEVGVDGIYYTDMGVYQEAKKIGLEKLLIYNPETILTNSYDLQAYLDLGIKMATISKEIPLEDMQKIGCKINGKLEVIIHGRLNMMHSKRNLLTNYMDFIKENKDLSNNYKLYLMEENRDEHMPIIQDEQGTHIYTGFTMCAFEEIDVLVASSINNFKIECLFMNIDEICQIIEDYRLVLENPVRGREYYKKYQDSNPTQNITKGFLYKKTGLLK